MEQPDAAERHGNAVLIAGVNDLLVADRAAGLDNGGHAGAAGTLDVVAEGEEGVGAQADTGDVAAGTPSFPPRSGAAGCSVKVSAQTSSPMTSSGVVADVHINGVVAVGLGNIVTEGQVQHLVHVAQLPVVGLLARQTGAVDAALLAGAHADGLAVLRCSRHCWTGCISG